MKKDKKVITAIDIGIVCLSISAIGNVIMIIIGFIYEENVLIPISSLLAIIPTLFTTIKKRNKRKFHK